MLCHAKEYHAVQLPVVRRCTVLRISSKYVGANREILLPLSPSHYFACHTYDVRNALEPSILLRYVTTRPRMHVTLLS